MKVAWRSPSNIALVKYWGKFGVQLPQNPSISFTLGHSTTELSISATAIKTNLINNSVSLDFLFEEKSNLSFQEKITAFLNNQVSRFPWLINHHLEIHSSNTFPHSSGVASSASSMSALCLSLFSLDELITGNKLSEIDFRLKASELSRLASGSASRSVYGGVVSWGETTCIDNSSNQFASKFYEVHNIFKDFRDSILIVDDTAKSVSSRMGHELMNFHLFRDQRFQQGRDNLIKLVSALKSGDLNTFIEVVEEEALTLHALMMTSTPSFILLKPESLQLIQKIRSFRAEKNIPVCFTIDAGPNIHLLYPKAHESTVRAWIEKELAIGLVGKKWIHDEVGSGPVNLEAVK